MKHITITSGGKEYAVKFGMNALAMFCEMENISFDELNKLGTSLRIGQMISLAYCGLKEGARVCKQDFNLTKEDIGDMMDDDKDLITNIMSAFSSSQAVVKEEEEGEKLPVKEPAS